MAATLGDALISLGKLVVGGRAVVAGIEGLRDAMAARPIALADATAGPPRITLHRVTTLRERVDHIRRMAHKGKVHPAIYQWTRELLSQKCGLTAEGRTQWCTPEKDGDAEVIAIFNGVKDELRYTHDPVNVDGYAHPVRSLQWHAGDCVPEGTLVLRHPCDLVPVEEVAPGDTIMGDGQWTRVVAVADKGVLPTLLFGLNNACAFRCTAEHRVFRVPRCGHTSGPRDRAEEALAGDLRVGDDLLQPERLPFGREALSYEHALILGAYVAEGWWDAGKSGISISGIAGGKGVREKVMAAAARMGISVYESRKYVLLRSLDLKQLVAPCGHRAPNKRLPRLDFDEATVRAILEGLDADGGFSKNGTFVFSTTSPTLAIQYRLLRRMLGCSTSIRRVDKHGGFGLHPIYRVTVRDGKKGYRPHARIKSIADGGNAHVYDLTTDTGRFYLPESDIVVHNCDDAVAVLAACLMSVGYQVKFLVIRTKEASDWNHILLAVKVPLRGGGHKWSALDATVQQPPGWYPPPEMIADAREFDV